MENQLGWPSWRTAMAATKMLPPSLSIGIREDSWQRVELLGEEILQRIQPTAESEERRKAVIGYVQRLLTGILGAEVLPFGSVPLKTYLPDGDIDLTAIDCLNPESAFTSNVISILNSEEQNEDAEFEVKDTEYINAEVKLVKCLIQNMVVDISFNQIGGVATFCFLEMVDRQIGKDHLFKRSIILIKAWCYYESRILGAHHGLISTYALEMLILHIFNIFHKSLYGPLGVLFKFLDYFSKFDWNNYCVTLCGRVTLSSLPKLDVESPESDDGNLLLSKEFMGNVFNKLSLPSGTPEKTCAVFLKKHMNIVDPLKETNNLGRTVSKGNFYRIRSALNYGARKLGEVLAQPQELMANELRAFFMNTLNRYGKGERSDVQHSFLFGSISSDSDHKALGLSSLEIKNDATLDNVTPSREASAVKNSTVFSGCNTKQGPKIQHAFLFGSISSDSDHKALPLSSPKIKNDATLDNVTPSSTGSREASAVKNSTVFSGCNTKQGPKIQHAFLFGSISSDSDHKAVALSSPKIKNDVTLDNITPSSTGSREASAVKNREVVSGWNTKQGPKIQSDPKSSIRPQNADLPGCPKTGINRVPERSLSKGKLSQGDVQESPYVASISRAMNEGHMASLSGSKTECPPEEKGEGKIRIPPATNLSGLIGDLESLLPHLQAFNSLDSTKQGQPLTPTLDSTKQGQLLTPTFDSTKQVADQQQGSFCPYPTTLLQMNSNVASPGVAFCPGSYSLISASVPCLHGREDTRTLGIGSYFQAVAYCPNVVPQINENLLEELGEIGHVILTPLSCPRSPQFHPLWHSQGNGFVPRSGGWHEFGFRASRPPPVNSQQSNRRFNTATNHTRVSKWAPVSERSRVSLQLGNKGDSTSQLKNKKLNSVR